MSHDDPDDRFRFNANYHRRTLTAARERQRSSFLAAIPASSVLRSTLCMPGAENVPCRSSQAGWGGGECRRTTMSSSFQKCLIGPVRVVSHAAAVLAM